MTRMTEQQWAELAKEHEIAYFRADVCLGSPQSYSLEEKRRICEDMDASTAKVESAMRDDFNAMPPQAQALMLDLLEQADPGNFAWWLDALVGEMPNAAPVLE